MTYLLHKLLVTVKIIKVIYIFELMTNDLSKLEHVEGYKYEYPKTI